jgi:hypothetical protein
MNLNTNRYSSLPRSLAFNAERPPPSILRCIHLPLEKKAHTSLLLPRNHQRPFFFFMDTCAAPLLSRVTCSAAPLPPPPLCYPRCWLRRTPPSSTLLYRIPRSTAPLDLCRSSSFLAGAARGRRPVPLFLTAAARSSSSLPAAATPPPLPSMLAAVLMCCATSCSPMPDAPSPSLPPQRRPMHRFAAALAPTLLRWTPRRPPLCVRRG